MTVVLQSRLMFTRSIEYLQWNIYQIDKNDCGTPICPSQQVSSYSDDIFIVTKFSITTNRLRCRLWRGTRENRLSILEISPASLYSEASRKTFKIIETEHSALHSPLPRFPCEPENRSIYSHSPPRNVSVSRLFLLALTDPPWPSAVLEYPSLSSSTVHVILAKIAHVSYKNYSFFPAFHSITTWPSGSSYI